MTLSEVTGIIGINTTGIYGKRDICAKQWDTGNSKSPLPNGGSIKERKTEKQNAQYSKQINCH